MSRGEETNVSVHEFVVTVIKHPAKDLMGQGDYFGSECRKFSSLSADSFAVDLW